MGLKIYVKCPKGHCLAFDVNVTYLEIDFEVGRIRFYCSACDIQYSLSLWKMLEESKGKY